MREAYIQFGEPMRVELEHRPRDPSYPWAVNVPGYGWHKSPAGYHVILSGTDTAKITITE